MAAQRLARRDSDEEAASKPGPNAFYKQFCLGYTYSVMEIFEALSFKWSFTGSAHLYKFAKECILKRSHRLEKTKITQKLY